VRKQYICTELYKAANAGQKSVSAIISALKSCDGIFFTNSLSQKQQNSVSLKS
jgi:hypothetical protein